MHIHDAHGVLLLIVDWRVVETVVKADGEEADRGVVGLRAVAVSDTLNGVGLLAIGALVPLLALAKLPVRDYCRAVTMCRPNLSLAIPFYSGDGGLIIIFSQTIFPN